MSDATGISDDLDENGEAGIRTMKRKRGRLTKVVLEDDEDVEEKSHIPDAQVQEDGVGSSEIPDIGKIEVPSREPPPRKSNEAQMKKLGKKRGRQTVFLEMNESLQMNETQVPRPVPPKATGTRGSRISRELNSEPKQEEVVDFDEEPMERVPKKEIVLKPQYQRPNLRKPVETSSEDKSRLSGKKQQGPPVFKRQAAQWSVDSSIERLHRQATCEKLWQQSGDQVDLQRVPGSFSSIDEYIQVFEPLLFEECRAQLFSTWEELCDLPGKDVHIPVRIKAVERRDRGWYDVTAVPMDARHRLNFKEGDVAVFSTPHPGARRKGRGMDIEEPGEEGEVSSRVAGIIRRYVPVDVRDTHGCILFVNVSDTESRNGGYSSEVVDDLQHQGVIWYLSVLGTLATTQREYVALHALRRIHPQMINAMIQPQPEMFPRYDQEQVIEVPCLTPPFHEHLRKNFNGPQLSAIQWAAMHTASGTNGGAGKRELWPFTLVQGPPGTGKTHTVWGMLNVIHLVQYQQYYTALLKKLAPGSLGMDEGSSSMDVDQQPGRIDEVLRKMDKSLSRLLPKLCPKPRILVCAPSNAATDELLARVLDRGFIDGELGVYRPDVARVGTDPQSRAAQAVSVEKRTEELLSKNRVEVVALLQQMHIKAAGLAQEIQILQRDLNSARQGAVGVDPEILRARDLARDMKLQHMARLLEERDKHLVEMYRFYIVENFTRTGGGSGLDEARSRLEESYANEAELVFTTVSSSGRKLFTNLARPFDIVVIDEAAQASEVGVLPPLTLGASRCVLVGDPQQLPATVISRVAETMQFSRSLFERFQQAGCPTLMLTVQFRMHPQIRDFPSRHFYQGRLQDSESIKGLQDEIYHHDPLLKPYLFFDVSHGRESHIDGSVSYQNVLEAKFAARLYEHLQSIVKASGKPKVTVGVISPYKLQLKCIQKEFNSLPGDADAREVYINTVDAFQGQERDVIIMSCVRASSHGVGFVADIRRMNVALTRARRSLWVIGNATTLLQSEDWAALIADAKERGCFVSYSAAVEKGLIVDNQFRGTSSSSLPSTSRSSNSVAIQPPPPPSSTLPTGRNPVMEHRGGFRRHQHFGGRGSSTSGDHPPERRTADSYLRQHNSLGRS